MNARRPLFPGFPRALAASALLGFGAHSLWKGVMGTTPTLWEGTLHLAIAPMAMLFAVALWFGIGAVRIPACAAAALLAADAVWHAATQPGVRWQWLPAVVLAVIVWDIWQLFSPSRLSAERSSSQAPDRPLISLVLLLRRPRHLDASTLARYCETAWGGRFEVVAEPQSDDGAPASAETPRDGTGQFVTGKPPLLIAAAARRLHLVHCSDRPYFEDPTAISDKAGEARLRKVLEENRGWLAVDLVQREEENVLPEEHYPRLARLLAELAGPDCQAIYQPSDCRFNHWDDALETKLRQGDVKGVFTDLVAPPVVEVGEEDPRMVDASNQARTRWNEFVEAFTSGNAQHCAVKAPVTVGSRTEFIWITVESIQESLITGRLGNEPIDLGDLKLDSRVTVDTAVVADWVFFRDEQPTGLFSLKALSEIQQERQNRS
jgi:uncharacterized protein YegJ (DUF2314 family)